MIEVMKWTATRRLRQYDLVRRISHEAQHLMMVGFQDRRFHAHEKWDIVGIPPYFN